MILTGLPLPAQLALGSMALVALAWGHAVRFPAAAATGKAVDSTQPDRVAAAPLPLGTARVPTSRPARLAKHGASALPTPRAEAARLEGERLAEALSRTGLFGAVQVRLEEDGQALVAPLQGGNGVFLPAAKLVRFASYVGRLDGLAANASHGAGIWPAEGLGAAMDAHLAPFAPPMPPATRPILVPNQPGRHAWAQPAGFAG